MSINVSVLSAMRKLLEEKEETVSIQFAPNNIKNLKVTSKTKTSFDLLNDRGAYYKLEVVDRKTKRWKLTKIGGQPYTLQQIGVMKFKLGHPDE